jgi:hypothetical protein
VLDWITGLGGTLVWVRIDSAFDMALVDEGDDFGHYSPESLLNDPISIDNTVQRTADESDNELPTLEQSPTWSSLRSSTSSSSLTTCDTATTETSPSLSGVLSRPRGYSTSLVPFTSVAPASRRRTRTLDEVVMSTPRRRGNQYRSSSDETIDVVSLPSPRSSVLLWLMGAKSGSYLDPSRIILFLMLMVVLTTFSIQIPTIADLRYHRHHAKALYLQHARTNQSLPVPSADLFTPEVLPLSMNNRDENSKPESLDGQYQPRHSLMYAQPLPIMSQPRYRPPIALKQGEITVDDDLAMREFYHQPALVAQDVQTEVGWYFNVLILAIALLGWSCYGGFRWNFDQGRPVSTVQRNE